MFRLTLFFLCMIFLKSNEADKLSRAQTQAIIDIQGITSFKVCQTKGKLINAALHMKIKLENVPKNHISQENVTFLLFTQKNPSIPEKLNTHDARNSIKNSKYFNQYLPVVLYVPGYSQHYNESVRILTSKLLSKEEINLVIVDWYSYANFNLYYSRNNTTPRLGSIVATFGNQMIKKGANPKHMHFIGFSVGGQVVGFAGKKIRPKLGKILAIDPQGNCYNYLPASQRLSDTDADFVQIIHCTVGEKGAPLNLLGHATFYMNGGLLQPQCVNDTVRDANLCSHAVCDDYFFDSLSNSNSYIGVKCDSQLKYLFNECNYSDVSMMGYGISPKVQGSYYVDTIELH
ncbi:lipase member H-like isoform X1 [Planococcus citri]|uniref:lipase member H-like isoform X1 n=1 Tax=Planococcus citri TaxID=170843 RepID=UPI0031FA2D74